MATFALKHVYTFFKKKILHVLSKSSEIYCFEICFFFFLIVMPVSHCPDFFADGNTIMEIFKIGTDRIQIGLFVVPSLPS